MANRSDMDGAGRGYARQPQALVEMRGRDGGDDAAGGPTEVGSRRSAWERALEALTSIEESGAADDGGGSLRASIAERLHTRGASPTSEEERRELDVRPVRRRRR